MKGFMIAGTASGVGKTTVTLALIAGLRRRGLVMQPYKGGPDFLDTGHHTRIAGRTARNVDTWMLSKPANEDVFRAAAAGADCVLVEGMMGLFDGKDGTTETGSSAEIAKLLRLPVVLVLDASKSARSVAAVVLGFEQFDPQLRLAGVILNRAASPRHFELLKAAITSACRTPVLGWLPREQEISIPERHLGLQTVQESSAKSDLEQQRNRLAQLAESYLDLDALASIECGFDFNREGLGEELTPVNALRIGVARDAAFTFYYEDNLDLLRRQGAEIVPFSPLADTCLPDDLNALYLGGGYPELYASALAANQSMLADVRHFADSDRPIYAECGGMIYLAQQLTTADGVAHELAGVLPLQMEMTDTLVKFGYVTIELTRDCLLGTRGSLLRGHSFHYSRMMNEAALHTSYQATYSLSRRSEAEGFSLRGVLASYIHLHFRTNPEIARSFVGHAKANRPRELTRV